MDLQSPIIGEGGCIPSRYTCDGENVSPPLQWRAVPADAASLALIVDDPDAPAKVWVHWVLYDVPPDASGLDEGLPGEGTLPNGAVHGRNDFDALGYGGPCPPRGTHRYRFTLYALDTKLNLPPGASKAELLAAMDTHILAEERLTALYERSD
jgi:Raf kinase inhibitor-like YbhB/YbcL family protein